MIKNKIDKLIAGIVIGTAVLSGLAISVPAFAQTVSTTTPATSATTAANQAKRLAQVIARSDVEITGRIGDLNQLNSRVQIMQNVSSAEKASVSSEVQTETSSLTSLKAKIDADTDLTTARNDEKSIFGSLRIYALIIPEYNILVSSDRINTVYGLLNTVSGKLQSRITAAQTAGKDVSAMQTALSDLNAKIADAESQANTAKSGVTSLVPDNGNTTVAASNKAALVSARTDIKTGTSDLKTARGDAKTIIQDLKAMGE